jgi:hypothetical protein
MEYGENYHHKSARFTNQIICKTMMMQQVSVDGQDKANINMKKL